MPKFRFARYEEIDASDPARWLTKTELERLNNILSHKHQLDWLVGRWAAKSLTQKFLVGEPDGPESLLDIEICNGEASEPVIVLNERACRDLALSISHSNGLAYAGICQTREEGYVGVDIEFKRAVNPKLFDRVLSESERQLIDQFFPKNHSEGLIKFWSLKEAAYKCLRPHIEIYKRCLQVCFQNDNLSEAAIHFEAASKQHQINAFSVHTDRYYYSHAIASAALIAKLTKH